MYNIIGTLKGLINFGQFIHDSVFEQNYGTPEVLTLAPHSESQLWPQCQKSLNACVFFN